MTRGQQCGFEVSFTPSTGGLAAGSITIAGNNLNGWVKIPVSGIGAAPSITVSPSPLSFGSVELGGTSDMRSVTLTNTGTAPLVITDVTLLEAHAVDFRVLVGAPCTAQPNQACRIDLQFTPSDFGPRLADLAVTSNAASVRVPLRGFGEQFATETVHGTVTFVGTLGDVQQADGTRLARFRFRLSESSCGNPPTGSSDRWFHVTGKMDAPSLGNAYRTLLTGLLARTVTVVQVDGVPSCNAAQVQTLAVERAQIALHPR